MMPSLFIAHGAPLLAIEDNEYTRFIKEMAKQLKQPKSIIIFSAHWESQTQKISGVETYNTIHDFGGFPDELYQITYPATGNHEVTKEIEQLFTKQGISFEVDTTRGLDHGAWVVLRLMYPDGNIPVTAMSVNPNLSPEDQYKIGQSIAQLGSEDILIIGSGGTVHNLGMLQWQASSADEWAIQFDDWLAKQVNKWDLSTLFQYRTIAPNAKFAVPPHGNEHFIPLFYAMGAGDNQKTAKLLHRSYRYGSLSHSVWQFG